MCIRCVGRVRYGEMGWFQKCQLIWRELSTLALMESITPLLDLMMNWDPGMVPLLFLINGFIIFFIKSCCPLLTLKLIIFNFFFQFILIKISCTLCGYLPEYSSVCVCMNLYYQPWGLKFDLTPYIGRKKSFKSVLFFWKKLWNHFLVFYCVYFCLWSNRLTLTFKNGK